MNQTSIIVVFADPVTRKVEIDFPVPKEGIAKITQPGPGKQAFYEKMTREQRAHHEFWTNGTKERIDELIKDGRGAGLRQTLKWLLSMRIKETYDKTGWIYQLVIVTDEGKWLEMKEARKRVQEEAATA